MLIEKFKNRKHTVEHNMIHCDAHNITVTELTFISLDLFFSVGTGNSKRCKFLTSRFQVDGARSKFKFGQVEK